MEKALRSLCQNNDPPIPLKVKGKIKMMKALVEDLKEARVIDKTQTAQLQVWMILRNHAAHGQFEKVKRDDVKDMISGLQRFIRER